MDGDLILVIGIVCAVLAVPAILSAFAESRAPRMAAILVVAATGLITVAVLQKPGGYSINEIPGVIISVVARLI
jgi:hypothetical protein